VWDWSFGVSLVGILFLGSTPYECFVNNWINKVIHPAGEGNIIVQADKASLVLACQHTPAIGSNILSPAKT
jgi:hypothetical protein